MTPNIALTGNNNSFEYHERRLEKEGSFRVPAA